ncbi:MAG: DedA family protein [Solirubrobacteraceae bacterium]|nr:DedA family protein [Solirubrobacteraceae bacterium]
MASTLSLPRPARAASNLGAATVAAVAAALIATVGLAGALVTGAIAVPDAAGALSDASESIGPLAYLFVPLLALLETGAFIGLVVPGETAVVVGGVVAARGDLALALLIALVWGGAFAGDMLSFFIGRRLGRGFLDTHGPRLRIGPAQRERTERFFERHGGKAILLGRFVGVLRALTPFVAGASGIAVRRVLPYSAAGTLIWATTFTLVGYAFADSFETAGETVTRIVMVAAIVVGAALLVAAALRKRRADAPATS